MNSILDVMIGLPALAVALLVLPGLLIRNLAPRADRLATTAATGFAAVVLTTGLPLLLHAAAIPLTSASLRLVHATLAIPLVLALRLRKLAWLPQDHAQASATFKACLLVAAGFCLLALPVTHLAGIDTYKWQGMATNVRVERSIPWLIHPFSLFGFTPRSYPSAQPLMLSSIQMIGPLGVEGGFFVLSAFTGALAAFSCGLMGRRLFPARPTYAGWLSFLYVMAPVFVRYNHWATGRGLFLACMPMLLAAAIRPRSCRSFGVLLASLVLVPLTHKTGMLVLALLIPSLLIAWAIPRRKCRWLIGLVLLLVLIVATLVAPPRGLPFPAGCLPGAIFKAASRFLWMLPAAVIAILLARAPVRPFAWRWIYALLLLSLPISLVAVMYGAMVALLPICVFAALFMVGVAERCPSSARPIHMSLAILTVIGALGVVTHRSLHATPSRIREAARFLETLDPLGPYRVIAPGRARVQIHAYVSGCPRFVLFHPDEVKFALHHPPSLKGRPSDVIQAWMDFGRVVVEPANVDIDWYGSSPRLYYVTLDGKGETIENAETLYATNGVVITQPAGQRITTSAERL